MKLITFEDIQSSGIGPLQCMDWVENAIARKSEAILPATISLHPGARFVTLCLALFPMRAESFLGA